MRRLIYIAPILLFMALAGWFGISLYREGNPSDLPSALIDQPVPRFELPPLPGFEAGFSDADLGGEVALVNVFASWCVPCLAEHPLLTRLAVEEGIPLYGINYRDPEADAVAWLTRHGNPYRLIGSDRTGRIGIEWGVYGVPETYIIDADGRIRYRHVGPLTPDIVQRELMPLIAEVRG